MLKRLSLLFTFYVLLSGATQAQELFRENRTFRYGDLINTYSELAENHSNAALEEIGPTDSGKPLHAFIISFQDSFDPMLLEERKAPVILINNAIHAGEPCGVDASVKLATSLLNGQFSFAGTFKPTVIIIPAYNVGGMLNRDGFSRANQQGPEEHGFRGNARNLDLNRDFIKCDSENARTLVSFMRKWNPDVFIDTHTTNGADYPYTLTLIPTLPRKLNSLVASFHERDFIPALYDHMGNSDYSMAPYIDMMGRTPRDGIKAFLDLPRYSSGYASLFDCFSFIAEAHMLKPYEDRVMSTYEFLIGALQFTSQRGETMLNLRRKAEESVVEKDEFEVNWELDTLVFEHFEFRGYEATEVESNVTSGKRLKYHTDRPYKDTIAYYKTYKPTHTVEVPGAYVIPRAWDNVTQLLRTNGVKLHKLNSDTTVELTVERVESYETTDFPYEGHYLHYNITSNLSKEAVQLRKGDIVVFSDQPSRKFLANSLHAEAPDSYFAWNYFDALMRRKEYYSPYLFEDSAEELLKENSSLNSLYRQKMKRDSAFAQDPRAQLHFIYERSKYSESEYKRMPVFRVEDAEIEEMLKGITSSF